MVFFVRHGVTDHTGHRLSGRMPGIHLNPAGKEQAERTAGALRGAKIRSLYSSPIERCRETAEVISGALGVEVETVDDLTEVDYGAWTDRPIKSLTRTRLWTAVQQRPSSITFPEGESLRSVQARAVEAVEAISARHKRQNVCVVSHADVIRLVFAHYLGVHLDLYQRLVVAPASVSVLALDSGMAHIVALNSSSDGSRV